jgi:DNA-binding PadR family transcriptional regulator
MQDAILALLAKEPAHGYELRQRLVEALGPPGQALNAGQVYVTLSRLERVGLVTAEQRDQQLSRTKRVYELTAAGRERVAEWLADVSWSKVAPTDFHLKLVAAAATGLADPIALVDTQRNELLRQLREAQQLALAEPVDSPGALLLEGAGLRLAADLRWLELCEQRWLARLQPTRSERRFRT